MDKKFSSLLIGLFTTGMSSLLTIFIFFRLWGVDLNVPFNNSGDSTYYSAVIKGLLDNGWILNNAFTGAPFGAQFYDFTIGSYSFNLLLIKLILQVTANYVAAMNIFYIISFMLISMTAFYALFYLRVNPIISIPISLLYAFLPYHFLRGQSHLFLSSYYMVPLLCLIVIWALQGSLSSIRTNPRQINRKLIFSIIICFISGFAGIYYAFFACFFLFVSSMIIFLKDKKIKKTLYPLFLISIICFGGTLSLSPSLVNNIQHGGNYDVGKRNFADSEIYGLKISQLLLPVSGHRLALFSKIKDSYNRNSPLINENNSATLGLIGSLGFLYLIIMLFLNINNNPIMRNLSKLNLSAILLATIGGFGVLFAKLISPSIRGYNRISVFIAFFALTAVALLIQSIYEKYAFNKKGKVFFTGSMLFLLIFGIYDQTTPFFKPDYKRLKEEYVKESGYINSIEQRMPKGAMIFQLPYVPFPENPTVFRMTEYDHFRGYLQSKTLRWSYGAMKGREGDLWQRNIVAKPISTMIEELAFVGFQGIYLDRFGYIDNGKEIEKKLIDILKTQPFESQNKRLAFYNFDNYINSLQMKYNEKQLKDKKESILNALQVNWNNGFYDLENSPKVNWRWCNSSGDLVIYNPLNKTRKAKIDMALATAYEEISNLIIKGETISEVVKINNIGNIFSRIIDIEPGTNIIKFSTDAKKVIAPGDSRDLYFKVINFKMIRL